MLLNIQNETDFKQSIGQQVQLIGIYRQLNVAKCQDKTAYVGRVYIELADKTRIALETNNLGIRTPEEIAQFEHQPVLIIGTIHNYTTLWGGGQLASLMMACISNIQSINLHSNL